MLPAGLAANQLKEKKTSQKYLRNELESSFSLGVLILIWVNM